MSFAKSGKGEDAFNVDANPCPPECGPCSPREFCAARNTERVKITREQTDEQTRIQGLQWLQCEGLLSHAN
jgi:hypothetical protein